MTDRAKSASPAAALLDGPCPADDSVTALFTRAALATPEALALASPERAMTYGDLHSQSTQLARYLRTLGAAPGVLVGTYLDRSIECVVALLAIMKTGAAYVPVDPAYPTARVRFMMEDAGLAVLVTRARFAERLRDVRIRTRVVSLDEDREVISRQATGAIPEEPPAKRLAYVIYTSGSTGQPKGVEVEHASLLNLISWHREAFAVTSGDRASQVAGPAFDALGWELWPYLTAGASVHLVDDAIRTAAPQLRDWLVASEITIAFVPTAVAEPLVALPWPRATALRVLLTGAERLRSYPPRDLPFVLVNNYGPTEATVVATSGLVPACTDAAEPPPIGRPIANTSIYILDEQRQPVEAGHAGELYIGGTGVARGYLNRPELTAERFLPDPFDGRPLARMYRTGDLARFLPDGQIAFLGRTDDQIKLRGHRIEPEEIIAALDEHPDVAAAAVVLREDSGEDPRLVAYIVAADDARPSRGALDDHLRARLPEYMVPAVIVMIGRLPLTSNGKLDRSALPAPAPDNTLSDDSFVAPRTPVEERLASVVAALLKMNAVSITDNFFFLGGHSLLGTQLIARIRDTFGVELPLRSVFETPTVEELAAEIERLMAVRLETSR